MTQGGCYGGHSSEGMVRTSGKGSVACRDRWVGRERGQSNDKARMRLLVQTKMYSTQQRVLPSNLILYV